MQKASKLTRILLGLALLLGACAAPRQDAVSHRNATIPIGSKAIFEASRFAGSWIVVARIGTDACNARRVSYDLHPASSRLRRQCGHGAELVQAGHSNGTARFVFGGQDHWVLWADEGYRTAVIGAPDGRFAWVLNRTAQIPADRRAAAREILDFNGYDLSVLTEDSR